MQNGSLSDETAAELEALNAIFGQNAFEISTKTETSTTIDIKCVADDASKNCNIPFSVLLRLHLDNQYPSSSPRVELKRPRGLQENDLTELETRIAVALQDNMGMPVLYELITLVRDYLNELDVPGIGCQICLSNFCDRDKATGTECGHFFHEKCLGKYLQGQWEDSRIEQAQMPPHLMESFKHEPQCPVCRSKMSEIDFECLLRAPTPIGSPDSALDFDWSAWTVERQRLAEIFERQKSKGGIIDLEAERRKMLVTEDTYPATTLQRIILPTLQEDVPSSSSENPAEKSERKKVAGKRNFESGSNSEPSNSDSKYSHGARNRNYYSRGRNSYYYRRNWRRGRQE